MIQLFLIDSENSERLHEYFYFLFYLFSHELQKYIIQTYFTLVDNTANPSEEQMQLFRKILSFLTTVGLFSTCENDLFEILYPFRSSTKYHPSDDLTSLYIKSLISMSSISPGPSVYISLKDRLSTIRLSPIKSFTSTQSSSSSNTSNTSNGYTICLWVNLHKPSLDKDGAILYKFQNSNDNHILCHIDNTSLIFEITTSKKKTEILSIADALIIDKWQFICIIHSNGLTKTKLTVLIDGNECLSEKFSYPKSDMFPFTYSVIGGSYLNSSTTTIATATTTNINNTGFIGKIGSFILLNKAISTEDGIKYSSLSLNKLYLSLDNDIIQILLDPRHFDKSTNILLDGSINKVYIYNINIIYRLMVV